MMDARLRGPSARSRDLRGRLPSHDGEEWTLLFSIQLVLQVWQQTPSLDTGVNKGKTVSAKILQHNDKIAKKNKTKKHTPDSDQAHLSVIQSGLITFSPLSS